MLRYGALVLLLFSTLAVFHTWPVAKYARSRPIDAQDGVINAWLLTATARQFAADPLRPFDINMYYPYRRALASLDHQFSSLPIVAPVTLATGNPLLAMNVLILAGFALAGTFAAVLARHLTGSAAAGLVAGSAFAFSPVRLENLPQTHVLGSFWLPLALYAVHRAMERPSWTRVAAAMAGYLLLALASWYYAIIGAIGLAIVTVGELIARREQAMRTVGRGLAAAIPVVLVLAAVARPYASISREFMPWLPRAAEAHAGGSAEEEAAPEIDRTMNPGVMQALSASVESYAAVSSESGAPWTAPLRRYGQVGARFFPGFAAWLLAGIAVVTIARAQLAASKLAWIAVVLAGLAGLSLISVFVGAPASPLVTITRAPGFFVLLLASIVMWLALPHDGAFPVPRTYIVLAAAGAMLSLGAQVTAFNVAIGEGVYPAGLPPFNMLRAPARVGVLYTIALAVLAGFGSAALVQRLRSQAARVAVAAAMLAVINVELMTAVPEMPRVGRPPEAYAWLNTAPPGPVLEFPLHRNGWGLYWSLYHRNPVISGYGLIEPAAYHRLKHADHLSPEMIEHLRSYFHPRYIVVNRSLIEPGELPVLDENLTRGAGVLTPLATFGPRVVYEVNGPSRGDVVLRSYRPWMLRGRQTVEVRAKLAPVPLRGAAVVQVWGNGHLLASGAPGTTIAAPLPRDVDNGLDVEVMADYRLPPGSAVPLGRTGRLVAADIAVTVSPERTRIRINGHVWVGRKGYTLVALDRNGRVEHVRGFNTSWSETDSHALAAFVKGLAPDRIVAIASTYDVARSLTADAVEALATIGLAADLRGRVGWAHAGVGVTGAARGTAPESIGESTAECLVGTPVSIPLVVDAVRIY